MRKLVAVLVLSVMAAACETPTGANVDLAKAQLDLAKAQRGVK